MDEDLAKLARRNSGPALVIDDDRHLGQLLETLLTTAGFQPVIVAYNGWDGLQTLGLAGQAPKEVALPDIVICDFELGDLTGYEIVRKIRQAETTRGLPVVMITATSKPIADLVMPEVTGFIKKPFSNKDLLAALVKALRL